MLMQILSAYVANRVINSIHNAGSLRSHNSESLHASYVRHCKSVLWATLLEINRLKPNDPYMDRIAPLTSKRCILYIYSTNRGTEYFKNALYSPFFLFKMQFVS